MSGTEAPSRERSDYEVWATLVPRYCDQDPMQHINNVAIGAYLEQGRLALVAPILERLEGSGVAMVLGRMTVDYLGELTYPAPVEIGGRLIRLGGRSLVSHYAGFQNGHCCVVSEAVNVFFDIAARKSASPPEAVRTHILERI